MFLKKIEGPRSVKLPNGQVLTRSDLPPKSTTRWVASRKAQLVLAVASGLVEKREVTECYDISDEEFSSWMAAVHDHGPNALKTTRLQKYRQLKGEYT